ncbi:hypothetical protein ACFQ9X_25920 [Catenulispora yoronensis]
MGLVAHEAVDGGVAFGGGFLVDGGLAGVVAEQVVEFVAAEGALFDEVFVEEGFEDFAGFGGGGSGQGGGGFGGDVGAGVEAEEPEEAAGVWARLW